MNIYILIVAFCVVVILLFFIIFIFNRTLRKGKRKSDFLILKMVMEVGVLVAMAYSGLKKGGLGYLDAGVFTLTVFSIWQSLSDLVTK